MRDYEGFRFGNIHSEDLHLVVVSQSNRYPMNLLPQPTDYTTKVPGGDGSYYFGSTFENREFQVNVAFDSVSEMDFRRIQQLFATDKLEDLVFDEMPFKVFKAKLKQKPDFKTICFTDRETGERVYKGEGTLNFVCYFPYAFGFNKYVVRAADFYRCLPPDQIIKGININPYEKQKQIEKLTGLVKNHYNVKANLDTPWKGGYPTIEQVQCGELYFNDPTNNEKKMIIDVPGYFDNVPEWQSTAKLLVSPTLDYDNDLIYAPQYCKTNYYNMDTGMNQQNAMIGSRILVYNPGDIPVDFNLKLGNLGSSFRYNLAKYNFRISRYNVQRLTIEQAVDWTGLKTFKPEDNETYKYGNKYFVVSAPPAEGEVEPQYRELGQSHPKHTYVVEPIPQEELGYFIRLFYWQTSLLDDGLSNLLDYEEGEAIATRYEEMRAECTTEDERNELYWKTLYEAIISKYSLANRELALLPKKGYEFLDKDYTIQDFFHDYIYNPPEYIKEKEGLKYGQYDFNLGRMPSFCTKDYFDINNNDFDKIIAKMPCGCDNIDHIMEQNKVNVKPLNLDTEKRMLYNISTPEWKGNRTMEHLKWQKNNPDKMDNFYDFRKVKTLFNDNIEKGHWFKIPPGWSMIDISPIVDEDAWGGKTWLHAASFKWGSTDPIYREKFDKVYRAAAVRFLSENCPDSILIKKGFDVSRIVDRFHFFNSLQEMPVIDSLMDFRRWFEDNRLYGPLIKGYNDFIPEDQVNVNKKGTIRGLGFEMVRAKMERVEYTFLKLLAEYWRVNTVNENGMPCGDIDEWWWYASNYIWANFPPIYWGYADLLNNIEIEYTPLFY